MRVYIKNKKRKQGQFQFYMHQFVEAAIGAGIRPKSDLIFDVAFRAKQLFHSGLSLLMNFKKKSNEQQLMSRIVPQDGGKSLRNIAMKLYPILNKRHKKKAIIITSTGSTFFRNAFPFFYRYEIIPMLWDVWPFTWEQLYQDLMFFKCKVVFVTVRQVAEQISATLPIKAYWIPEGIDPKDYNNGALLVNRLIDVYEFGRQKREYHTLLEILYQQKIIKDYRCNVYGVNGGLQKMAFATSSALITNLSNTKVLISFPLIDTHPQKAQGVETLTQRYWEAMLSRCLIVGRAPQELIDFIGYDPVVAVDWSNPEKQIAFILNDISDYQELVDYNYQIAQEKSSWDNRIRMILDVLSQNNYCIN